jgi:hypothetical protein
MSAAAPAVSSAERTAGPARALARPAAPAWPVWASGALVVSGGIVIALETTNLFVVVGAALLGAGVFGLLRRWPIRRAHDRVPG